MSENLLNIRMHASLHGRHLSGAEQLVETLVEAEETLLAMLQRALQHPRGRAERISLRVEEIPGASLVSAPLLDFSAFQVADWACGRQLAVRLLCAAGVSGRAAQRALDELAAGAAPDGSSMRGAMLIDAESGARLEADPFRGVRVSRMDLAPGSRAELSRQLAAIGLDGVPVREALTLASKVCAAPAVIAELCWSDDPDYPAGYVASAAAGYQRIDHLKAAGDERGGRAFFLRAPGPELAALIDYLEKTPVRFDRLGSFAPPRPWRKTDAGSAQTTR